MNQHLPNLQSIVVQNSTTDCEKLFNFLDNYSSAHELPKHIYNDLRLIIEETFVNIANYAHKNNNSHPVTVKISSTDSALQIVFIDTGYAFNPVTDSQTDLKNADLSDGGMGIPLIKALSDHLKYERIDQHNVFTVTKHYTNEP
jgi:anti-sigma regulatory factor (Ser/Thr protein kinase)